VAGPASAEPGPSFAPAAPPEPAAPAEPSASPEQRQSALAEPGSTFAPTQDSSPFPVTVEADIAPVQASGQDGLAPPGFEDLSSATPPAIDDGIARFDDDPTIEAPRQHAPLLNEMSRDELFGDDIEAAFGLSTDNADEVAPDYDGRADDLTAEFDADLFDVESFDDEEDQWELKDPDSSKRRLGLGVAAIAIGVAFWWVNQQQPAAPEEPATTVEVQAAPTPEAAVPEAAPAEAATDPAVETTPESEVVDAKPFEEPSPPKLATATPTPKAKPKPKPTRSGKSKPPSARRLIDAGWKAIGTGDLGKARQVFTDATYIQPRSAMAHYGLAYSAAKQGDDTAALKHYCVAHQLTGGAGDVYREVQGILERKGWTCD
jgi:cytoskeletal protein RodZ